jgi:hypothetical protein
MLRQQLPSRVIRWCYFNSGNFLTKLQLVAAIFHWLVAAGS